MKNCLRNKTRLNFFLYFCILKKELVYFSMELHFTGIIIAVCTFAVIGLFHPIVLKTEYYTGTKYWWVFLVVGIGTIAAAFMIENVLISALHGVVGASSLWSIGELFEQRHRCEKGWFPKNPKRIGTGYYKEEETEKK